MTRRYELILAERTSFPLTMMVEMLGVSRSGYYSWVSNGCPVGVWSDVREAVRRVWSESNKTFGHRFVHSFMPDEHASVALYRVLKCMRELKIKGCHALQVEQDHGARQERQAEARRGADGGIESQAYVSEILTQVNQLSPLMVSSSSTM